MHPTPVILLGGFLGAGKTTLIGYLLCHLSQQHKRVAAVTNDQAANLVDTAFLATVSPDVAEVAGACFCCSFDNFIAQLKSLDQSLTPDLLIGEPVGSCTDLSATVVNPLKRLYSDMFRTAPYSVLIDPARFRDAFASEHERPFPDDVAYIYRLQIEEADAIVVNKIDTLSAGELTSLMQEISVRYPGRPVFPISAQTGAGVEEWLYFVMNQLQSGQHQLQVDYDRYAAGEAALAWLNVSAGLAAGADTDWPRFADLLLETLREKLVHEHAEIAHLKLFLSDPAGSLAANIVSNTAPIFSRGQLPPTVRTPTMLLNARVQTTPDLLRQLVTSALQHSSVPPTITTMECFSPARPTPTHPPAAFVVDTP